MKRRPWFKFHTQDWRADPNLRMCSPAARGLWADMLSLMHEADPYGHLIVGGIAPSEAQLARLLSIEPTLIAPLIGDLSDNGVFSRTEDGVIFSRRMVRDAEASDEGRENIAKRWGSSTKSRGVTSSPIRSPNRDPITEKHADPITKSQSQSVVVDVRAGRDFKALVREAQDRAGAACNLTSGHVHHVADLRRLIDAGCDWDRDVLPAIDALAAGILARKSKPLNSWAHPGLIDAATTNRDRRLAGLPAPSMPSEKTNGRPDARSAERAAWDAVCSPLENDAADRPRPPVAMGKV